MRFNQVRDFLAVFESGSLRAAARALGVSQPGLTKSVRALEAELGVPLMLRTTRGVVPTKFGRAFLARAQVVQAELRKAEEDFAQLAGDRAGSVAFGFGPLVATLIVPEAVARFRQQFPRAHVRLVEGLAHVTVPLVRDETLDFAVAPRLPGIQLDAAISFRPLFRHPRVVAARKGHPLSNARSLAQLVGATWLVFEPRSLFERMFSDVGLPPPRPAIQCESANASLLLFANTDVVALLPRGFFSLPSAGGVLQEIAIAERIPSFTFGLFKRADAPLTPIASGLAKAVTAVARRLARAA